MKLILQRQVFTDASTAGELFIDSTNNQSECFTLEPTQRLNDKDGNPVKVPGETAIPAGTYELIVKYSEHNKMDVPWLLNVPGFDSIEIHPGNYPCDTKGCILVGQTRGPDFVGDSRIAFNALLPKIQAALGEGKVFISVIG